MAKIVWDELGSHLFETGVDHGVLYPVGANGTYPTGVAWNGLTGITQSPSGADETKLWADNIKYVSLRAAEEFGGTIEAYTYPDEFADCDGSATVVAGLTLVSSRVRLSVLLIVLSSAMTQNSILTAICFISFMAQLARLLSVAIPPRTTLLKLSHSAGSSRQTR